MYKMILEKTPKYPDKKKHGIEVPDSLQDLINRLLEKDMDKRLGSEGGVEEIIAHPFFAELDIDDLMARKIEPDFVPKINPDKYDVSNFDESITQMTPKESFITDEERQGIISKISDHQSDFKEITED